MLNRSFDKQLEGARQAEAAAARALADQVSSKNPAALWLDSILGTSVAKPKGAEGRVALVPAVATVSGGAAVEADSGAGRSYFQSSVAAYGLGLGLCFVVNYLSKSGQPGEKNVVFFLVIISNSRNPAAFTCSIPWLSS